jgi:ribose transport system substrate-binding protein
MHYLIRSTRLLLLPFLAIFIYAAIPPSLSHAEDSPGHRSIKSVGILMGDLGNPLLVYMSDSAAKKVKELCGPETKISILSCGYDLNTQINQIENLISAKTDLIILNAADSKSIAPAVQKAKAAGIVVVAMDVSAEGGVDATVMSNNVDAGKQAGDYIVQRLKGKGDVVIVNGPNVSSIIDRVNGIQTVFKQNPGIHVLSFEQNAGASRDGGYRVMSDLLQAFPKIDAVFAINDPTAIGCALAATQARRDEFFIVGVDGAAEVQTALKDKMNPIAASPAQDFPGLGSQSVQVGYDIFNGKKLDNPIVLIPIHLLTKDNIGDFKGPLSAK